MAAFTVTPSSSICGVCIPTACRLDTRDGVPALRFLHSRKQGSIPNEGMNSGQKARMSGSCDAEGDPGDALRAPAAAARRLCLRR